MQRLSWLVMVLAACGGGSGGDGGDDGDDGPDRVEELIGAWRYLAGASEVLECDGDRLDEGDLENDSLRLAAGTSSDLVVLVDPDHPCPGLRLDVNGSTAKAQPGQTCTEMIGSPPDAITAMSSFDPYRVTLDSTGTMLAMDVGIPMMLTGSITRACTFKISGTLVKSAARSAGEPRTR